VDRPAEEQKRSQDELPDALVALGTLGDPIRRALFRYVAAQPEPVGREQAAAAVGVAHHVARFHLDRLHDAGLLQVEYRRPAGRGGPGAGRPTKLYRPTSTEFSASVPERRYDIAGLVLARAMAAAVDEGTPVGQALEEAACDAGHALGREAKAHRSRSRRHQPAALAAALDTLEAHGFTPRRDNGGYVLANCPFRALAQEQPDVVCRLNLALVTGLLEEAGVGTATARLEPADDRCCVTVRP
jgi:predicted ArsR family transcriptional regulator